MGRCYSALRLGVSFVFQPVDNSRDAVFDEGHLEGLVSGCGGSEIERFNHLDGVGFRRLHLLRQVSADGRRRALLDGLDGVLRAFVTNRLKHEIVSQPAA